MIADDTRSLIIQAQEGDPSASERLVVENNGLIWSIVRRFFGRGVEPDDLYQLACIGFLKAVHGFDPDFGTKFSTYAVPKITGEIRRFLRDDGAVKVSRGMKERAQLIRTARSALEQRLGRAPVICELSAETELSPEEIAAAELSVIQMESLEQPTGEDGLPLERTLGSDGQEEQLVERVALEEALGSLPERERMVVSLRFYHALTQEQTARILHISQVQVSRTERKALERLRELLKASD